MATDDNGTGAPKVPRPSSSAPPPRIKNPYATLKSSKTSAPNARAPKKQAPPRPPPAKPAAASTSSNGPRPLQAVEIGASASFSQAFSSIEDTEHYQKELKNAGNGSKSGRDTIESWAEQRAFDESAAAADATQQGPKSARDNHAFLQQQPHVLYVSTKQRGNGVLQYIRNVPFQFANIVPDYLLHTSRCALFLSIKYHNLHPNYIHRRIAELKSDFVLRILLVLVDIDDNANALLHLNKLAVRNNLTLILAWTEEEAARYLETYKALEGKDASSIQKKEQTNFTDQMADVFSTVRSVNKTDAATLLSQFGSFKGVLHASMDELCLCPGVGEKKVKRLYEAFHKPFSSHQAKRRREEKNKAEEAQVAKQEEQKPSGNMPQTAKPEAASRGNDVKQSENKTVINIGDGKDAQGA